MAIGLTAECVSGCPGATPPCEFNENNICTFPGVAVNAASQGVFPAEYAFVVVDRAGNRSIPRVFTFTVDHLAPQITAVNHIPTEPLKAGFVIGESKAYLRILATDPLPSLGLSAVVIDTLNGPAGDVRSTQDYPVDGGLSQQIDVTQAGWNYFSVRVRDAAGNERKVRRSKFLEMKRRPSERHWMARSG